MTYSDPGGHVGSQGDAAVPQQYEAQPPASPVPSDPVSGAPAPSSGLPAPTAHYPPPYLPTASYGPAPASYAPPTLVPKSVGAAVALELVLGLFGIFGVGNLYARRVAVGLILMVSFWVLFWINILLTFILSAS